ncbi:DUF6069 family protein [Amnibacterium soli]|uniref:DUF6069 family protein n=1 Tax=Amnibacterium soli TaxID=1282736 RepID=A0ABP8YRH8_9MICO
MTATTAPSTAATPRVLLAAGTAAVLASAVNVGIALAVPALGLPVLPQLMPAGVVAFTVVAAVVGAIGWQLVRRRSADPRRLLTRLVPIVLAVSFVPDVALGVATATGTGPAPVLALALMHLTTIVVAVAVYARVLPVRNRAA